MENDEIEVTEQMMEAGWQVLLDSGITDARVEADKLVLAEIYRAMAAIARSQGDPNASSGH